MVALEELGRFTNGGAFIDQSDTQRQLVGREFHGSDEFDPSRLGRNAAAAGALVDENPLEFSDTGKHGKHHPTGR